MNKELLLQGMNRLLAGTGLEPGNNIVFDRMMWEFDTKSGVTATYWTSQTDQGVGMSDGSED